MAYADSFRIICFSQWVVYAVPFVVLIFPTLDRSVWAALALKLAAPKVCEFSCCGKLRFKGELYWCS